MTSDNKPTGVLLAGGRARRMGGGDKCLLPLGDKTLLTRGIERARDQVSELVLSANGNALRFARTKLPVVPDVYGDYPGPLAGIHAAMSWMHAERPDSQWLASFACDTPFFPTDMVQQLHRALEEGHTIAVARSGGRIQPVFALWHISLLDSLAETLQGEEIPWLQHWIARHDHVSVDFATEPFDPFTNINAPADLYAAQDLLTEHGDA